MRFTHIFLIVLIALFSIPSHAQFGGPDTLNFEYTNSTSIDFYPDTSGLWQVGIPDKKDLGGAHGGDRAITTDSIYRYPTNQTSSFTLGLYQPSFSTCNTRMCFWHQYSMTSPGDYGTIEASYDEGNSWIPLRDTNVLNSWDMYFWWEGDYNETTNSWQTHQDVQGSSDGWIKSCFYWNWWTPVKLNDTIQIPDDYLYIKFTMHTDSIHTSQDGWMIDDITIYQEVQYCSSIEENDLYSSELYPNPATNRAILETEQAVLDATLLIYNALGQCVKTENQLTGSRFEITREDLPAGIYFVRLMEDEHLRVARQFLFE